MVDGVRDNITTSRDNITIAVLHDGLHNLTGSRLCVVGSDTAWIMLLSDIRECVS
jgi:hypothetical protein